MKTRTKEAPYMPLLIWGVAVILLSTPGMVAVMAGMPTSADAADAAIAASKLTTPTAGSAGVEAQIPPVQAEGKVRGRIRMDCEECGVVMSRRSIERLDALSYEVTLRMNDGSSRVFMDAHPANWRPGERVIFIEGANRTND